MPEPYEIDVNPDARGWDEFVCAHQGHLLQSSAWGDLKARFGWTVTRIVLQKAGALVAGGQILFKSLPLGLRLAYVPRGPVVDPADDRLMTALFDALCSAARDRGAFALRLEPDWTVEQFPRGVPAALDDFRHSAGFQPQASIHLDLACGLDTILEQMKPKWRYNIRLSARKGVKVREAVAADLPRFYQLLQTTSTRDHFAIHSLDYYASALELLRDHAALFIAEFEQRPLAGIMVTAFGNQAIYLYGASSNVHRERMPNHALHWAAIQWAKARGCAQYDLWGIDDGRTADERRMTNDESKMPADRRRSSSVARHSSLPAGLYQFKRGFGGRVVHYVGAHDMVFSQAKYALYTRALAFRRAGLL